MNQWIANFVVEKEVKYLLFCFPYAGGNSGLFHIWKSIFPKEFAVLPVETPGKGRRRKEIPYTSIHQLVKDFGNWLISNISKEFILFGHSMGALVIFELARFLEKYNFPPKLIVLSGCAVPFESHNCSFKDMGNKVQSMSDQDLIDRLRKLNGTPIEILNNYDLLNLFLPVIRADFSLLNCYSFSDGQLLGCPILVLGGSRDPEVPPQLLKTWEKQTKGSVEIKILDGDHFFIHSQRSLIRDAILKRLAELDLCVI